MDFDDLVQSISALLNQAFDDLVQSISSLLNHAEVQRLSQLLLDWTQDNRTVLYIIFALGIGFFIGRRHPYRYLADRIPTFQNRGEVLLSHAILTNFGPPNYHLMNHVTLQLEDGTTQVDHILVSRFGVFVIETKDYKGWIFANAKQKNWTQVLINWKSRFQNPIRQNYRHVRAVQSLLDNLLQPGDIESVVVFTGEAEFKTEIPPGVFNLFELVEYLHEQTAEVMSLDEMQLCVGRLETARYAISGQTDVAHVQNLERRHGSTTY